jgi:ABC-type antimicrobial peptide transport system permease subunit
VLDTEYVKLAHIKGVSEHLVIWKYCFHNALIVSLTHFGLIGAVLITGSVVTETVLAWPGLGQWVSRPFSPGLYGSPGCGTPVCFRIHLDQHFGGHSVRLHHLQIRYA